MTKNGNHGAKKKAAEAAFFKAFKLKQLMPAGGA